MGNAKFNPIRYTIPPKPGRRESISRFDVFTDPSRPQSYLRFCNGDRYYGPVAENGLPGGGNGIILYRDGSAFAGQIVNGQRSGRGTFIHAPTDVQYDGEWQEDFWHGVGSLYSVHDGTVLQGVWDRGELVGEGRRIDLASGLTWIEMYEEGRLVSQKVVNVSPSGNSSSSSKTSKHDSLALGEDDEAGATSQQRDLGRSQSLRTDAGETPGSEKMMQDQGRYRIGHSESYRRSALQSKNQLMKLGTLSSIVGSPSFFEYCCLQQQEYQGRQSQPLPLRGSENSSNFKTTNGGACQLVSPDQMSAKCISGLADHITFSGGACSGRRRAASEFTYQPNHYASTGNVIGGNFLNGAPAMTEDETPLTLQKVLNWTNEDVCNWLQTFNSSQSVLDAFKRNNVTGQTLLTSITRDSLRSQIGIFAFGYRAKIIENLKLLKLRLRLAEELQVHSEGAYEHLLPHLTIDPKLSGGGGLRSARPRFDTHTTPRPKSASRKSPHPVSAQQLPPRPSRSSNPRPTDPAFENSCSSFRTTDSKNTGKFLLNSPGTLSNFHIPFEELEFIELLGEDRAAFSSVFRGRWLGKEIAIKVFSGWLVDQEAWDYYVNSLTELRHPNLVLILGVSVRHPDLHCIVMEFAAHLSLADHLHGAALPALFDAWMEVERSENSICQEHASTFYRFFKSLSTGNDIPKFHKHENRSMITAKEAGSSMPLNAATEHDFEDNEDQTLLTMGKARYPETSRVCTHVHHYLDQLITLEESSCKSKSPRTLPTMTSRLETEKLTQPVLLSIARGIILACFYLKQKGIQSLNLKSSNVLVDESFHTKLTDFGQRDLARAFTHAPILRSIYTPSSLDVASRQSSNSTDNEGTSRNMITCPHCHESFDASIALVVEPTMLRARRLNWCSPETLRIPLRFHGINEASDIYSFGVILWNLLTDQVPFVGLSPTQIRVAVGYAGFQLPMTYVWAPLQRLVSHCLSFLPDERPSFDQILHTLVNIHQSATSSAENALMSFMQGDRLAD